MYSRGEPALRKQERYGTVTTVCQDQLPLGRAEKAPPTSTSTPVSTVGATVRWRLPAHQVADLAMRAREQLTTNMRRPLVQQAATLEASVRECTRRFARHWPLAAELAERDFEGKECPVAQVY